MKEWKKLRGIAASQTPVWGDFIKSLDFSKETTGHEVQPDSQPASILQACFLRKIKKGE